jgi:hypothetical protein
MTSVIANELQKNLSRVITDDTDGVASSIDMPKYCDERKLDGAWEEDQEIGGIGLAVEMSEGSEIPAGSIREGFATRYNLRKFGMRLIVTEEAIADNRYPEAIVAAKRLKRAIWKTIDIDAALMLARAFNTDYTIGDGVAFCSASHTLPKGGTFSNLIATAMSPSHAAVSIARTQAGSMPSQDGLREGYKLKQVLFPIDQQTVWEQLLGSTMVPEAGNFAAINVVHKMKLEPVPVLQWTNTTTNYIYTTDAEDGLNFRWGWKPRSRSWVENSHEVMQYSVTGRWTRGMSNARGILGCNL